MIFYALNGWALRIEDGEAVALMVDVAEGQIDVPTIAGVLKNFALELEFPGE